MPRTHTPDSRRSHLVFALAASLIGLLVVIAVPLIQVLSAPAPIDYTPGYLRAESRHIGTRLTDAGYWQTSEFHGRYYNIDADGERRVLGQPVGYTHTLWLFGNSGTYDPYMPDSATMATDLQLLFDRAGYAVRVVNRSAGGQHISGELAWLKLTPVAQGDAVVFVDGAMDQGTPERNSSLVASARAYSKSVGAAFYHFVQASSTTLPGGIAVPHDGFVEGVHLNGYGDNIVARAVFDALTLI